MVLECSSRGQGLCMRRKVPATKFLASESRSQYGWYLPCWYLVQCTDPLPRPFSQLSSFAEISSHLQLFWHFQSNLVGRSF
ncbi:hypothetical protein CMV_025944 [Castanea mollissima]|uniref:Uncharacterized protein n=1 Tax=Castanea mollissima TaxID=60419 RepID=A0A8J4QDB5_9ROSI|nr:hypothetical protein CMV_025944 [Castanea mollissima]